jgi:hypothetical protein
MKFPDLDTLAIVHTPELLLLMGDTVYGDINNSQKEPCAPLVDAYQEFARHPSVKGHLRRNRCLESFLSWGLSMRKAFAVDAIILGSIFGNSPVPSYVESGAGGGSRFSYWANCDLLRLLLILVNFLLAAHC